MKIHPSLQYRLSPEWPPKKERKHMFLLPSPSHVQFACRPSWFSRWTPPQARPSFLSARHLDPKTSCNLLELHPHSRELRLLEEEKKARERENKATSSRANELGSACPVHFQMFDNFLFCVRVCVPGLVRRCCGVLLNRSVTLILELCALTLCGAGHRTCI